MGNELRSFEFEPYSLRAAIAFDAWHFVLCCALRNARGATLLASLESELSDSASLRYLRPARLRLAAVRRLANPFIFAKKKKTEHPKGYSVLGFRRMREL